MAPKLGLWLYLGQLSNFRLSLEGEIQKQEVWTVLKKTKDKSAPGLSGFTYTFFKDFWAFFGDILTNAFNEAYNNDQLPEFMSRGVISLLPKGDKDRSFLKIGGRSLFWNAHTNS